MKLALAAALALGAMVAQASFVPPFGTWKRLHGGEPILVPQGDGFEASGVFNPAVIKDRERYLMLYRAQDGKGTSRLGLATSLDGIHFAREPQPVLVPEAAYERGGGVEDPRLVKIGSTFI